MKKQKNSPTPPALPIKSLKAVDRNRKVAPEVYVKCGPYQMRRAHFRIRGVYRYLVWRDGGKLSEYYLGRHGNGSPTTDPTFVPAAAAAPRPRGRGKK